jgi:hypothetical protein
MQVRANPGAIFTRAIVALAKQKSYFSAIEDLETSGDMPAATVLRSAVTPITTDVLPPSQTATSDFLDIVRAQTILGRLRGAVQIPFEFKFPVATSAAAAFWVEQGAALPVAKLGLTASALFPLKLATLVVLSNEILTLAGPIGEAAVQRSLVASVAESTDQAFIDPAISGTTNAEPASITHGATTVSGSSDPAADIKHLIEVFAGDLAAGYFVCNPLTAARLALHRDSGGAYIFPNCGVRGGDILQIPLLTSRSVPIDSAGSGPLILIDPTGVQFADDGISVDTSFAGTLAMSDSPSSPAMQTSLFQTNSAAVRVLRYINWQRARDNSVAYISAPSW